MKFLFIMLAVTTSCASRPDAITGVVIENVPRDIVADSAEGAAMCLGLGFDLPTDPFSGVRVTSADLDASFNYRDNILVPANLERWKLERQLSHEFIHVALTRYRPRVANHHQWMEQAGVCFGGCRSMPQFNDYRRGCE